MQPSIEAQRTRRRVTLCHSDSIAALSTCVCAVPTFACVCPSHAGRHHSNAVCFCLPLEHGRAALPRLRRRRRIGRTRICSIMIVCSPSLVTGRRLRCCLVCAAAIDRAASRVVGGVSSSGHLSFSFSVSFVSRSHVSDRDRTCFIPQSRIIRFIFGCFRRVSRSLALSPHVSHALATRRTPRFARASAILERSSRLEAQAGAARAAR